MVTLPAPTVILGSSDPTHSELHLRYLTGPVFDVKDGYGAAGGGADDGTAIQAAIDAANTVGGGTVTGSLDTYGLSSGLTLRSNVSLIFPFGTIFKVLDGSSQATNWLLGTNVGNFDIEGLTIDLNKANTTDPGGDTNGVGIYIQATNATGVTGVNIRRCLVKNGHQIGIRLNSAAQETNPLEITVEHSEVADCDIGIRAIRGSGIRLLHNDVHGNTEEGINCLGGINDLIEGNHSYENGGAGIVTNRSSPANNIGARIIGNECWENGADSPGNLGWGINVSDRCQDFVVEGNICRDNYQGGISVDVIDAAATSTIQDSYGSVMGNVIEGFSGSNASNGVTYQGCKGGAIAGNTIRGQAANGILLNKSRKVAVTGNGLYNNVTGINMAGSGTTPASGFHDLSGNMFDGNTTDVLEQAGDVPGTINYDGQRRRRKTANQSKTSDTTLADVTDLGFAVEANQTWEAEIVVIYNAPTTGDIKFGLTVPASATYLLGASPGLTSGAPNSISSTQQGMISAGTIAYGGAGDRAFATLRVVATIAGTAGTAQLQFAQQASDATATTVYADSVLRARRIA